MVMAKFLTHPASTPNLFDILFDDDCLPYCEECHRCIRAVSNKAPSEYYFYDEVSQAAPITLHPKITSCLANMPYNTPAPIANSDVPAHGLHLLHHTPQFRKPSKSWSTTSTIDSPLSITTICFIRIPSLACRTRWIRSLNADHAFWVRRETIFWQDICKRSLMWGYGLFGHSKSSEDSLGDNL